MRLFNFDHGLSSPTKFQIGPFTITVSEEHIANLARLPRRSNVKFEAHVEGRAVSREEHFLGDFVETAFVNTDEELDLSSSALFPEAVDADMRWDLVLLLSFLTGRRVYEEEELRWDPRRSYGDRVIPPHDIAVLSGHFWSRLPILAEWKLADALSCLVHLTLAPEAIGCGLYASAALDATVSSWSSRNNKTKYIDKTRVRVHFRLAGAKPGSECTFR